jgi:hypothetical protein
MHGRDEEAYAVLVRKPERKGSLGRHTCGWEDNIGYRNRVPGSGLDLSGSGGGPLVGLCKHINEVLGSVIGSKFS